MLWKLRNMKGCTGCWSRSWRHRKRLKAKSQSACNNWLELNGQSYALPWCFNNLSVSVSGDSVNSFSVPLEERGEIIGAICITPLFVNLNTLSWGKLHSSCISEYLNSSRSWSESVSRFMVRLESWEPKRGSVFYWVASTLTSGCLYSS